jgi:hypothetical protein
MKPNLQFPFGAQQAGNGMDPDIYDRARARLVGANRKKPKEPEPTGNLFDHVSQVSPHNDLLKQLVTVAIELEAEYRRKHGPLYGLTIGEVEFEAEENRGICIAAPELQDKGKQQRALSGLLARVLPHAGFVRTASYRSSPVKRQHGSPHRVYVRREAKA